MRTTKNDWKPPHPDWYTPGMWVKNRNTPPKHVMIHRTPYLSYRHEYYNIIKSDYFYDEAEFRDIATKTSILTIIPITKLQIRMLPYLGTAFDENRELCWMPWVLSYIREVLDEHR